MVPEGSRKVRRLAWPAFAGVLFTAWGLLAWSAGNEPNQTRTELAPAVVCEVRP